jgi:hypothetical protein
MGWGARGHGSCHPPDLTCSTFDLIGRSDSHCSALAVHRSAYRSPPALPSCGWRDRSAARLAFLEGGHSPTLRTAQSGWAGIAKFRAREHCLNRCSSHTEYPKRLMKLSPHSRPVKEKIVEKRHGRPRHRRMVGNSEVIQKRSFGRSPTMSIGSFQWAGRSALPWAPPLNLRVLDRSLLNVGAKSCKTRQFVAFKGAARTS